MSLLKPIFLPTEKERLSYGPTWRQDMLMQYTLYTQQLDTLSTMREKTNEFFLTLQTAFLGAVGFLLTNVPAMYHVLFLCVVAFVGITESYFWYSILHSYKTLKDAKFKVLHEWESILPLSVFVHEMEVLKKAPGRYIPLTKKELFIPLVFGCIYFGMGVAGLWIWMK